MSGQSAASSASWSRCKNQSAWIPFIASLYSPASTATQFLPTLSTSSTKVHKMLVRWVPSRQKWSTSHDPFHSWQANPARDGVPFWRKREAIPEELGMPSKEGLWRDVPASAEAGHRDPEQDNDLRPSHSCHSRRDPLARILHGVPKEGALVRKRANPDGVRDELGEPDAGEPEAELQERIDWILSQEMMISI